MIFLSRGIFLLGSKKKLAPYLLFKTKEKSLKILEKNSILSFFPSFNYKRYVPLLKSLIPKNKTFLFYSPFFKAKVYKPRLLRIKIRA